MADRSFNDLAQYPVRSRSSHRFFLFRSELNQKTSSSYSVTTTSLSTRSAPARPTRCLSIRFSLAIRQVARKRVWGFEVGGRKKTPSRIVFVVSLSLSCSLNNSTSLGRTGSRRAASNQSVVQARCAVEAYNVWCAASLCRCVTVSLSHCIAVSLCDGVRMAGVSVDHRGLHQRDP
eukprot:3637474-Rhodomonas_salina.1